jgi:hypothetical protein
MRRLFIAFLVLFAVAQLPSEVAAQTSTHGLQINNVKGTLPGGGFFTGNILIEKFLPSLATHEVRVDGMILQGTVTTAQGAVQTITNEPFSTRASLVSGAATSAGKSFQVSCPILFLDLEPIHLNLLGLVINVSEITINVTAIQGGGLLGNLLCSLDDLLSAGSPLAHVLIEINQLLDGILAVLSL